MRYFWIVLIFHACDARPLRGLYKIHGPIFIDGSEIERVEELESFQQQDFVEDFNPPPPREEPKEIYSQVKELLESESDVDTKKAKNNVEIFEMVQKVVDMLDPFDTSNNDVNHALQASAKYTAIESQYFTPVPVDSIDSSVPEYSSLESKHSWSAPEYTYSKPQSSEPEYNAFGPQTSLKADAGQPPSMFFDYLNTNFRRRGGLPLIPHNPPTTKFEESFDILKELNLFTGELGNVNSLNVNLLT